MYVWPLFNFPIQEMYVWPLFCYWRHLSYSICGQFIFRSESSLTEEAFTFYSVLLQSENTLYKQCGAFPVPSGTGCKTWMISTLTMFSSKHCSDLLTYTLIYKRSYYLKKDSSFIAGIRTFFIIAVALNQQILVHAYFMFEKLVHALEHREFPIF